MVKWFDRMKKVIGGGAAAVAAAVTGKSAAAQQAAQDFTDEDDSVIFAGILPPEEDSKPGEVEFGMYVKLQKNEAVWLPAITDAPAVIEKLQAMKLGEQFRITAERSWGAMGTRVDAIAQDAQLPVIPLAERSPGFLKF